MSMHRSLVLAALAIGMSLTTAGVAHADKSAMTVSRLPGHDVQVVVHGVTDYCATDAATQILRHGESIRIVRDRPTRVSRCMSVKDVTVIVHDVEPGTYRFTYEQIPLVAPARALTFASTTTTLAD